MNSARKTGLDFLRLFATIQVILFHNYHQNGYGKPSKNFLFTFYSVLSKTNNFHFMLISSYIGCKSQYLLSKTIPLILSTICYSLISYIDAVFFFHYKEFDSKDLFEYCFPLAFNKGLWYIYPFLVSQFLLSFMYPTFEKLNKKYHFTICIIFIFIFCFPSVGLYKFSGFGYPITLGPFFCMSFIGSYIRFHYINISNKKLVLIYILLFYYNFYVHQNPQFFQSGWKIIQILGKTWILNFPSILFSIPLFLLSLSFNKQFKYHYIIKALAECSMGVFSFHYSRDHKYYWTPIVHNFFINLDLHWIFVWKYVFKIYFCSILVELSRQKIFNCLIFNRKYYRQLSSYINHILMDTKL